SANSPPRRSDELAARTRTSPDFTYCPIADASVAMISAFPPSSAATASPPPSYDTYFTDFGPIPYSKAGRPPTRCSIDPDAEPPASVTDFGSFLIASNASFSVLYGESAFTTIAP